MSLNTLSTIMTIVLVIINKHCLLSLQCLSIMPEAGVFNHTIGAQMLANKTHHRLRASLEQVRSRSCYLALLNAPEGTQQTTLCVVWCFTSDNSLLSYCCTHMYQSDNHFLQISLLSYLFKPTSMENSSWAGSSLRSFMRSSKQEEQHLKPNISILILNTTIFIVVPLRKTNPLRFKRLQ